MSVSDAAFADKCELGQVAELPIAMKGLRPTVIATINAREARLFINSGALFSMMSPATAAQYELQTHPSRVRLGPQQAKLATIGEFTIGSFPVKNLEFIIAGSEYSSEVVGMLGQNFLQSYDVEYDLGHGLIRLFQTKNCTKARLAYWQTADQSYSQMDVEPATRSHPLTVGTAYMNDQAIKIVLDSGFATSILSSQAAQRIGVQWDSKTFARFASLKIGDGEEIKNSKVRTGQINLQSAGMVDMVLGVDFLISHRIFVGNNENKLYFSYGGGPVFDLSAHEEPRSDAGEPFSASESSVPQNEAGNPSELAAEGTASVSRGEISAGLVLLSKAIAMSPDEPEFYFQRGNALWANKQFDLALADFDQVIQLKTDFLPAYIPRAELELSKADLPAALADLETVDHLAPKQADLRYSLGVIYQRIDHLPEAIAQYGLWIDAHPKDARTSTAVSRRCYVRALAGQDLPDAINDCDRALRTSDRSNIAYANLWVERALVRIRMGEYGKAIGDCNDALKMSPKNALALYVRAVAEMRNNKKSESEADLKSARQIDSTIGQSLARYGFITP